MHSLVDRVLDATVVPGYSRAGYELRRLAWPARGRIDADMTVHAMHPGWVDTPGLSASLPRFHAIPRPILRTAEQGADTIV